MNPFAPKLYGPIENHKDNSIRFVVYCINSPTRNLSKKLNTFLKSITNRKCLPKHNIKLYRLINQLKDTIHPIFPF